MSALVRVDGLVVEVGTPGEPQGRILDGVDLSMDAGEVVGVIGASGSGKSTLGLALAGYVRPGMRIAAGRIGLAGRSVLELPRQELRALRSYDVAFVPQSAAAAFNPAFTIDQQVIEIPVMRGDLDVTQARAVARDLYAALKLPEPDRIGRRYPHQVSGGQLQRAGAAMAFARTPKLIVFDEPTTALDVTTQVEVLGAFRAQIRANETAALYVSHDLAVVAQIAKRVVVMERGQIVDDGDCQNILAGLNGSSSGWRKSSNRLVPPQSKQPLLTAEDISFRYRSAEKPALNDVSLSIGHGEVVGLIGESGSGKTTLARIIAGLLEPSNGRLIVDGQPVPALIRRRGSATRKTIQIAFQSADVALNPRQTIGACLARPLSLFRGLQGRSQSEEVRRLLSLVDLPSDMADRFPNQLSGGQKQRVNLARALAAEPTLVICDEVTSALDADLRGKIVDLLRRLRSETNTAFLFVTHDLSTAADFADRIVVMNNGRVVESGSTDQVLSTPSHAYTADLIRAVPRPDPGWLDEALSGRTHQPLEPA